MEFKRYNVYIEPSANVRLAFHVEFLAQVSEKAAVDLYEAYKQTLEYLTQHPNGCPVYIPKKQTDSQLRYKIFGKRYRIVFEIDGNSVYVYDIQDCRQNFDKNLM
jgi:mRNA-degrading endonuclease RelE of RelBE toxin-antitoxin system